MGPNRRGYLGIPEEPMRDEAWMDRIAVDPRIRGGEPCIRGTRTPVSILVGSIADGDSVETLLASYPGLTHEDLRACLKYAAEALRDAHLLPRGR